ncbi:hypothetical protein Droror1_Dr00011288 [Drosera rotundifolia]
MEFDHDEEDHEEEDEEEEEDINLPPPQSYDSVPQPSATRPRVGQLAGPRKPAATKYRECLKNHAVSIGGHATDGCGEFLPAGDEGTFDALMCAACSCHRNFHRKETDVGIIVDPHLTVSPVAVVGGGVAAAANSAAAPMYHHPLPPFYQHHRTIPSPTGYLQMGTPSGPGSGGMGAISSPTLPSHHHHFPYRPLALPSPRDEMDDMSHPSSSGGGGGGGGSGGNHGATGKKRFRTKFSQEQKEKMLVFAERIGWRIQKQDEALVQQFCEEAQVKRPVLKVWMHNNKHTLGKKP